MSFLPYLWCLNLHTVLKVRPHQIRTVGQSLPSPALVVVGLVHPRGWLVTLLDYVQLAISQNPDSFCGASHQLLVPECVHRSRVVLDATLRTLKILIHCWLYEKVLGQQKGR